ncbi:MAG: glucosamine-6-phosphate deaminase [Bacteroidaceae bacterium]|nr:glucosamine-6-phosphate deaminase [Bacteroidaceae bacterium]
MPWEYVTVEPDEQHFDCAAADRIVEQIKTKPDSVVGLSTGRTTGAMHRIVAERWRAEGFDARRTTFFGVDEVVGVPRDYSGACYTMLRTEILDAMGIEDDHFLMLPTESDDFLAACSHFTDELARRGGIDLLILGLGENGHLGFNQPGTPFDSRAWVTTMNVELEERIRRETATPTDKWLGGVTLGLRDIMHARRIVLVAKGKNKADIVLRMLRGPVMTDIPASVLQLHPCCEFLLDRDAASKLC